MIGKSDEITTLNTLTATLIDSVKGYRDAAENSESGRFQELFRTNADERNRVCEDLRAEVRWQRGSCVGLEWTNLSEDSRLFLRRCFERWTHQRLPVWAEVYSS